MKVIIDGVEYAPAKFVPDTALPIHKLFGQARARIAETLREVGENTGLSMSTICNAESGDGVTLLTAIKLCRYYGIDLETLADSVETHGIPNAIPRTTTKRKAAGVGRRA